MGHKSNPIGLRLQINRTWDSRWYADTKDYADFLNNDIEVRDFLKKKFAAASVSRVKTSILSLGSAGGAIESGVTVEVM